MSDIHLLTAIHKWFLFPHFKWCQLGDSKVGGTPSFLSRHMLVRYFLMIQQVTSVTKGRWRDVKEFTDFISTLDDMNNDEEETQIQKVEHFLRIVKASLDKHFKIWIEPNLFFLSAFSEHKIAHQIVRFVQGKEINNSETYRSEVHGYDIKFCEFQKFLKDKCDINAIRGNKFIQEHILPLQLIANGHNIWHSDAPTVLTKFRQLYVEQLSALPTNSQFTERGVKESGYVSLGRRSEKYRSTLAIARAKIIPDAMASGNAIVNQDNKEKRLVEGKLRTRVILEEAVKQHKQLLELQKQDAYNNKHKHILSQLTCDEHQFKKARIDEKVGLYIRRENDTTRSVLTSKGYHLTPLLCGKIQYAKMLKKHNFEQVRNECRARNLLFDDKTNYKSLIGLIKNDENDNKYFKPKTNYDLFKWNETHFTNDDE